jgi:serine/threonine protein kinase/DNA polymerase III delta prime subunit
MAEQIIGGRYRLQRRITKGDARVGVPELWTATDAGDVQFVKLWRRQANDEDIRALWNREIRGLMRLQGHPGAGAFFVKLLQLGIDEKFYFAVLEGGRRQPLSLILPTRSTYPWLGGLRESARRRVIWEGLMRIAEALGALHQDGTLHRSLGSHSVLVGPDGTDFRLSGFEWSLRIAGSEGAAATVAGPGTLLPPELEGTSAEYSTASDWFAFGLLCAELLGVSSRAYRKRDRFRDAVKDAGYLHALEQQFILGLTAEDSEDRMIDEADVIRSIRDILRGFNVAALGANRPVVLAVRLGLSSDLAKQVEVASGRVFRSDDPGRQLAWIRKDLAGDIKIVARRGTSPFFVLRGRQLEYRVRPWTQRGSPSWDIGYCDATALPKVFDDDQVYSLGERTLDVRSFAEVQTNQTSIRTRSATWDKLFPFARSLTLLPGHLRDVHDFFRVTQQLDVALTAATLCPVEIVSVDHHESGTHVEVKPMDEPDRSDLAALLNLPRPAEQVREWFALGADAIEGDDESDPKRTRYSLPGRKVIGRGALSDVSWTFMRAEQTPGGPRYRFKCKTNPALVIGARAWLGKDFGGTIAQIQRRDAAIANMRSHESLLELISDPIKASRINHDELPPEKIPIPLDDSKLDALLRLWRSEPSFAVQGPPGTGKTTLIKAFIERLMGTDRSAQVLLTAHSHHTVDDVLGKLAELFEAESSATRPIMVRLGGDEGGDHDPAAVTGRLLNDLAQSELSTRSSAKLRKRLSNARQSSAEGATGDRDLRTMQLLIQDAANVTCATSNSPDLAKIVSRGRRFDWSIIEEAGKAHGFDLALALQESHRLVLIGDHHQLPPFNAKTYTRLLEDPLRVREAIRKASAFAPNLIDSALVEDEEGRETLEDRCKTWLAMVEFFAMLFTKSIVMENGEPGPAARLVDQHRMHPHIADLVGNAFYPLDGGGTLLRSPPETHARFDKPPPFLMRPGSWMPEQRIVWCDVPWVQRKEFSQGEVTGLFEAPAEIDAIVDVLAQFEPVPDVACEVQILSPYNGQLMAIRRRLLHERQLGHLGTMFAEPFNLAVAKRIGATVDEFQGSEADIVVASLVRNNALPAAQSLGFLRQPNRPNVLLSRARQKLIIVGSWEFFETRCNDATSPYDEHFYVGRMMEAMKAAEAAGELVRVQMKP